MITSLHKELKGQYIELAKQLEEHYPNLDFRNHCYWRIALDNIIRQKWDLVIGKPAIHHLTEKQLTEVNGLLLNYLSDKSLLLEHNRNSLKFRGKRSGEMDNAL
ncbi:MAG: acetyltransferase [Bacteroidota bacterium]